MTVLNKVSYVDQDFATAVTKIRQFLDDNYPDEFNDYVNSNLGLALIEIIAYAEQNLLWYMNRKVTDLYFPTAITPNSISKIARMLGYKSRGATTAQVSVTLTMTDGPYTFPVQINRGFQFRGPNNQVWEYRGDVALVFPPGSTALSNVVLSQGQTVVNNFISSGENNQFFELLSVPQGKFVESASVTVKVNNEEWTEHPVIPFVNENVYETNLLSFPPVLRFGDGVQGNIPPLGSAIEVSYVITDGFRGRIVSSSITEPVVSLVAQFEDIPLEVSQPLGSAGGDDPEDIRSITVSAPLFQKTQDRAITKSDYDFIGNQFPNVARSDAQIVRGISGDVTFNVIASSLMTSVEAASQGISVAIQPYMDDIDAAVSGLFEEVEIFGVSAIASISDEAASISASVGNIASATNTTLDTMRTDIQPYFDAAVGDLLDIDTKAEEMVEDVSIIVDVKKTSIESLLTAIDIAVSGTIPEPIVNSYTNLIRARLSALKSEVVAALTAGSVIIDNETDNVRSSLDSIIMEVEQVSGEIATAVLPFQEAIAADLASMVTSISGAVSGFEEAVSGYEQSIEDANASIDQIFLEGTSGLVDTVSGYVQAFLDHADEHLSDSCKGNKVQVKVLGKDANRKYVSPLTSTLSALKLYLEERKDITHTIDVVSGVVDVVNADVTITVRIADTAVEDDVVAGISDALQKSNIPPLGILVERDFNKPLYVWEIDGAIRRTITDADQVIKYLNIEITGPVEYLDDAGNLIPPASSVIQVGTITVKKLPRFTTDGL